MPLLAKSLNEIQEALRRGELTCESLVRSYLTQIEKTSHLNAYLEVYGEEAVALAQAQDRIFTERSIIPGKLWGAVFSIKDVISYKDHVLTAGSKMLQGYRALYSATAVQRLLNEGAIIIGRVNCDEFAMGSDNERSYYGPVKNALDEQKIPGGSSGGSAVSVQANTCLMSLGSDTGGSVRQPASFCNLIGFKPSYGRISRHGLIAYASSFDQIGVIGRNLDDIRVAYQVMQGPDKYDGTLVSQDSVLEKQDSVGAPMRLAYIEQSLTHTGLHDDIKRAFKSNITKWKSQGHVVDAVSFELMDFVIPSYYVLTAAEASSNLSRYDGIRYGYRTDAAGKLDEMYTRSRTEGFGAEVKRRILLGTFVLSVGYYDAYFAKAQKVRRLIRNQFEAWTKQYDAIVMPMTPTTAWQIGSGKSPVEIYLADIYSVLANLVGSPAISIPLGHDAVKMPFGLQILSACFTEEKLFSIAHLCETDVKSV
ncbi:MAG: Asp-tRNA(Asn)/Glu-tRNA(Gln) amidotransferase subunit GatA [Saprospiraceae bacterium]|nr:Asp-tRNA(Asn)/Glu-tRNA(Gln) amidotransferase subunit GatA [Saprospiraceae bacterium]